MSFKHLFIAGLMVILVFYGCGKKKSKETQSIIDSIKTTSLSNEQKSDDVFKEFYDEGSDKAKGKKAKASDDFPTAPSDVQFNPNGRYVVQVSCVLSKRLAQNVASKLTDKGYPAYIAEVENPTPELLGLYYRIRIGGFDGLSSAKSFAGNNLSRDGYDYWIDNRSNDNVGMGGRGLGESSGGSQSPYQSYQQPATQQTTPEPWKPAEPTPSAAQESKVTQPATPPAEEWGGTQPETPATQPAVQESTTPKTKSPATQTDPANKSPFKDEWGADTSGW